mmetsp:Transcript_22106/g.68144  ORF Transcript_22106/g.68144 Transcript_22106/m.68144 type:complete len:568 (-) Transcript_22106:20-1723(-)
MNRFAPIAGRAVRWGIMGTGTIASDFVRVLQSLPECEVAAVGSRSDEGAARFADKYGVATRHGSYEALAGGTFGEAFHMLTGFPVHQEVLNPYTANGGAWAFARRGSGGDDDKLDALTRERFEKRFPGGADEAETEFFALVYSYFASGYAVGASTFTDPASPLGEQMKALGLQTRHAYGVLDAKVYDGYQLIKLRNPNGVAMWQGNWSKRDGTRMTSKARKDLGLDREDPGVFWIGVDDVVAYFVELTVCRLMPDRVEALASGWLASGFGPGECVVVETYARTACDVAIYQEPHAERGESGIRSALDLGCAVLKCASRSDVALREAAGTKEAPTDFKLVAAAPRVPHRAGAATSLTLEHDDDPTTRYIVLPLCFGGIRSPEPRRFCAVVHAESPVVVAKQPCPPGVVAAALFQLATAPEDQATAHIQRSLVLQHGMANKLEVMVLGTGEPGWVVVAENGLNHPCMVGVSCQERVGYVSSRGEMLECQDVLPARSRQVLVVFTHDGSKRAQCRFGWVGQQMPGTAEAHMPPLEPENRDLHAPMPMDKEVVGANDLAAALAAAIGGSAS